MIRLDDLGIKPKYYVNYNIVNRQMTETVAEVIQRTGQSAEKFIEILNTLKDLDQTHLRT